MKIAHFISNSLGDIEKAYHDRIWQFGNHKSMYGTSVGDLIVISLKGTNRFFILGFAASKVKNVTNLNRWPSETDMNRPNNYTKEIDIAPLKHLRERIKTDVEVLIGFKFKQGFGCRYSKEVDNIDELL